jgi:hypothetical protein
VSHAPSYRVERWFGFRFVIVGSEGRRGGSTTRIDGASSHFGHGLYPLCSVGVVSQGELSESGHSAAFHCAGASR